MTQTTPEEMTIGELQHEIGKLQAVLFRKVAGDPKVAIGIPFDNSCFICGIDHGGLQCPNLATHKPPTI